MTIFRTALGLLLLTFSLLATADLTLTKSVDLYSPTTGVPVEFMVVVANLGPESITDIVVDDKLPPGLTPTEGMAVFTSQGHYDAGGGVWSVGELRPSEDATLLLPTTPEQYSQPACYVNRASIRGSSVSDEAVVYVGGATSCAAMTLAVTAAAPTTSIVFNVTIENTGTVSLRDLQLELRATNSAGEQEGYTVDLTDLAPGATYENELYLSFGCDIPADTADYTVNVRTSTPLTSVSRTTAVGSIRYPRSDTCVFELNTPYNQSCFIATAAYGSPLHPHVDALRAFRDRVLLKAPGGRELVALYYAHSPPLARAIAGNDALRWLARLLLAPLIYPVVYPIQVMGLVCLVLLAWMARRRRSRL